MPAWIFWLAVVLVLGVIEVATTNLVTIWFVASGLAALVVSLFVDRFIVCFAVFVLLGVLLLLLTRPVLKRYMAGRRVATNVDRVIGMYGVVTQAVTPLAAGEVKVDGKLWTAVSEQPLAVGDIAEVLSIDGVKLSVRRREEPAVEE